MVVEVALERRGAGPAKRFKTPATIPFIASWSNEPY